jgi:hypothetical protein
MLSEKEKLQKLISSNAGGGEQEHQEYLQLKYRNYQLMADLKNLKKQLHISTDSDNNEQHQRALDSIRNNNNVDKSFQEQIAVSDDHYKIPINIQSRSSMKVKVPITNKDKDPRASNVAVINSVENFQIMGDQNNVLQQPLLISGGKSSSTTTTTPTSVVTKKKDNLVVLKKSSGVTATTTKSSKKLPKFVLPIPPDIRNDESDAQKDSVKEEKKSALDETLNKPQNDEINELENGAHEINDNDFNDFNIEEKNQRSHFEDNLEQDKNMVNNAAEDEREFEAAHKTADKKILGNEEMDLEIINRPVNVKDKLKDEIANDHGKEEPGYMEDLHIEQQEDDLGDSKSMMH